MFDVVTEKLFSGSQAIRNIPNRGRTLYLTFDDGPDAEFTPQVLEVLRRAEARATFFVIVERARRLPGVLKSILDGGHRLGNHSLDHSYGVFFSSAETLKAWSQRSEKELQTLSGQRSVGFRPPNGIITPHLVRALAELDQPLILWNCRFFDTLAKWRKKPALRALRKLQSGDIILLHDTQRTKNRNVFLHTLEAFLREAQAAGWKFEALPENLKPTN